MRPRIHSMKEGDLRAPLLQSVSKQKQLGIRSTHADLPREEALPIPRLQRSRVEKKSDSHATRATKYATPPSWALDTGTSWEQASTLQPQHSMIRRSFDSVTR